jgi:hypothetical protein
MMKNALKVSTFLAAAVLAGISSEARADSYGAAGCGLGSMVFGNKPGMVQILAATTNGTFASQTFGITSGTSNCTDAGGGTASAAAFIESNRDALAKDISRGSGETIKNLSTLSGCTDPAAVGSVLQRNFKAIFPAADATNVQVSGAVVNVLRSEKSLACSKLGA